MNGGAHTVGLDLEVKAASACDYIESIDNITDCCPKVCNSSEL